MHLPTLTHMACIGLFSVAGIMASIILVCQFIDPERV